MKTWDFLDSGEDYCLVIDYRQYGKYASTVPVLSQGTATLKSTHNLITALTTSDLFILVVGSFFFRSTRKKWLPEDSPHGRFATEDSPHGKFATQRVNWACRSENSSVNVGQTFAKVPKWIGIFATW